MKILQWLREKFEANLGLLQGFALVSEGVFLLLTIFAFWHHAGGSDGVREHWLWLLWYFFPFALARIFLFKRIGANIPLKLLLLLFVVLSFYNFIAAPFHRESYLIVMGRPLLGVWMVIYMGELGRKKAGLAILAAATVGMGLVLGLVALTTSDWVTDKSPLLLEIARSLPRFEHRDAAAAWAGVRGCGGIVPLLIGANCFNVSDIFANLLWSFNPNEIAGALAWLCPVVAAFAVGLPNIENAPKWLSWLLRGLMAVVFLLLFAALILGQSRFAVAGVLGSLFIVVLLLMKGKWRWLGFGFVGLFILLQVALLFNLLPSAGSSGGSASASVGVSGRDESSFSARFEIWESAIRMMLDYPTTGVGMGMFRTAISTEKYLVPFFNNNGLPNPPHAHNEWLQMGADFGLAGFILYILWQLEVLRMLWFGWRRGDVWARVMAVAAFAGLAAHAVYGMGDAVTLWDRFQFVLWWLIGLATAQYIWVMDKEGLSFANWYSELIHAIGISPKNKEKHKRIID